MNRKEFIKTCGYTCLGSFVLAWSLQSCASVLMINGTIEGENIIVKLSDFKIIKGEKITFRKYIIVQNDQLQFPISLYRINDHEYNALWMRCSHQGNELTAYGNKLHCSAHGSEFDNYGNVTNGPASDQLKKFPVIQENELLKISIKAV